MSETMTDYVVPADMLAVLGTLWGGTPSTVSPLRYGTPRIVDEEVAGALAQAGVRDVGGQLADGVRPLLDVLGGATAFTRVYLSGLESPYEFVVYFDAAGRSASVINLGSDVQLSSPAASGFVLGAVEQTSGSSAFASSTLEATLAPAEAIVLGAMLDAQRKVSLSALAEGSEPGTASSSAATLAKACAESSGDPRRLAEVIADLAGSDGLTAAEVSQAADALVGAGLAEKGGEGFRLSGQALECGRRFLVPESATTLTAGQLGGDGNVGLAGFTCLQAGVHDLLYLESSGVEFEVRAITSMELLAYVEAFVTDPTVIAGLGGGASVAGATAAPVPAAAPVAAAGGTAAFCRQCGAKLEPDSAFCIRCGAKVG